MNSRKIIVPLSLLTAGVLFSSCDSGVHPVESPVATTVTTQQIPTSQTLSSVRLDGTKYTDGNYNIATTRVEATETVVTTTMNLLDASEQTIPFDTVHDCLAGVTYRLGESSDFFRVDSVAKDETGFITIKYTLTINDAEYKGEGGRFADGIIADFVQDEYSPNIVSLVYCDCTEELSYASVKISSEIYTPDPFPLSGNSEEEYFIGTPEYIETDDMIIFLGSGATIKGDITERIYELIEILEKESGLTFFNDSKYAYQRSSEHIGEFADVFSTVDYKMQKFHIYVVDEQVSAPYATASEAVVNYDDIDFDFDSSTLIHELTHSLHLRNGIGLGKIMTEGYAAYMTDRVIDNYRKINTAFDPDSYYEGFFTHLTPQNAEAVFSDVQENENDYYTYGYHFLHFLFERYGDNIFNDILQYANENTALREYDLTENAKAVPYIKACTSENVFAEFALWLNGNNA